MQLLLFISRDSWQSLPVTFNEAANGINLVSAACVRLCLCVCVCYAVSASGIPLPVFVHKKIFV